MLFDRSSIIMVEADSDDGGKIEYPYFTKLTAEAIALAKSRWPMVRQVIGPNQDELFDIWLNHLTQKSHGYFHCETDELWMTFEDTASFLDHVELCMNALSESRPVGESVAWQELLGQANAWDGTTVSPPGSFSFCGYAWDQEVPWE